jgi:hypothetical protein
LEGKFIYGWSGTELLLIPESSPDYQKILDYNNDLTKKVTKKELVPGKIYLNKQNIRLIYLGHFEEYNTNDYKNSDYFNLKSKGKKYWFYQENRMDYFDEENHYFYPNIYSSLTSILKECGDIHPKYADIMDALEFQPSYSPYQPDKYYYEEYKPVLIHNEYYGDYYNINGLYLLHKGEYIDPQINKEYNSKTGKYHKYYFYIYKQPNSYSWADGIKKLDNKVFDTEQELINNYTFYKQIKVLKNGKIIK